MEIFLQDRILPLLSSHLFSTGDANRTLMNHRVDIISMDRYTVKLCIYLYRRWCQKPGGVMKTIDRKINLLPELGMEATTATNNRITGRPRTPMSPPLPQIARWEKTAVLLFFVCFCCCFLFSRCHSCLEGYLSYPRLSTTRRPVFNWERPLLPPWSPLTEVGCLGDQKLLMQGKCLGRSVMS